MRKYLLEIEKGEGQLNEEDINLFKVFINYCYDNLKIVDVFKDRKDYNIGLKYVSKQVAYKIYSNKETKRYY